MDPVYTSILEYAAQPTSLGSLNTILLWNIKPTNVLFPNLFWNIL